MGIIKAIHLVIRAFLISRLSLAAEILALRLQVAVYKHTVKRPKLRTRDRVFWVWLSRLWPNWRSALAIVQPETVVQWHRQGFKLYWRWKSRAGKPGRPPIEREIRDLIRRMSRENPAWGAPRILSELLLLGYDIAEGTVAKYMVRTRKPPSQEWRTFLANHVPDIAACDFFTVPTATCRVLFVFMVVSNERRKVVHFNATNSPTASWTGQQIIDAFPWDRAPKYSPRDRDGIYGIDFARRVGGMGIEEVVISARCPWRSPCVEQLIGSVRRECLDHVIIFSEGHLRRVLKGYFEYYHGSRTHLGLEKDCPFPRPVESPELELVLEEAVFGGLHLGRPARRQRQEGSRLVFQVPAGYHRARGIQALEWEQIVVRSAVGWGLWKGQAVARACAASIAPRSSRRSTRRRRSRRRRHSRTPGSTRRSTSSTVATSSSR